MRSLWGSLATVVVTLASSLPALAAPCAAVVDRDEFTRRTERIFAGVRDEGVEAIRWHVIGNRRLPAGDVEITADLVKAIRPRLLVMHFSAFDPQPNATDNQRFGAFFREVELAGLEPHYVVYSRVMLDKAGMDAEISQHSRIPVASFSGRLSFVQVFEGNESKAVADVATEIEKLDLGAICAGG